MAAADAGSIVSGAAAMAPRPTIAVLNPTSSGKDYGTEGRRLGYRTIALMTRDDWPERLQRFMSVDAFDDVRHVDGVDEAVALLRAEGVVAVLPGSPFGLDRIDALTTALGLVGNPIATAPARVDKWLMKQQLVERGVPCPRFKALPREQPVADLAPEIGFPLIVKPCEGAGGIAVRLCRSPQELGHALDAVAAIDPIFLGSRGNTLVEQYIAGEEYCLTTANLGGSRKVLLSLARYEKDDATGRPTVYRNIWSMPIDDARAQRWFAYAADVNRALEVEYGINDIEFKAPDGDALLIELNNRLPGAKLPTLIELCTGINCYAENIRIFRGETVLETDAITYRRHFCVCCLINPEERVLGRVEGIERVAALPSFVGFDLVTPLGEVAPKTVDFDTAWAFVYLVSADPDALAADAAFVHATLTF